MPLLPTTTQPHNPDARRSEPDPSSCALGLLCFIRGMAKAMKEMKAMKVATKAPKAPTAVMAMKCAKAMKKMKTAKKAKKKKVSLRDEIDLRGIIAMIAGIDEIDPDLSLPLVDQGLLWHDSAAQMPHLEKHMELWWVFKQSIHRSMKVMKIVRDEMGKLKNDVCDEMDRAGADTVQAGKYFVARRRLQVDYSDYSDAESETGPGHVARAARAVYPPARWTNDQMTIAKKVCPTDVWIGGIRMQPPRFPKGLVSKCRFW